MFFCLSWKNVSRRTPMVESSRLWIRIHSYRATARWEVARCYIVHRRLWNLFECSNCIVRVLFPFNVSIFTLFGLLVDRTHCVRPPISYTGQVPANRSCPVSYQAFFIPPCLLNATISALLICKLSHYFFKLENFDIFLFQGPGPMLPLLVQLPRVPIRNSRYSRVYISL